MKQTCVLKALPITYIHMRNTAPTQTSHMHKYAQSNEVHTHASMWDSMDGKPARPGMTAWEAANRSMNSGRRGSKLATPNWRCKRDMAVWNPPAAMCSATS